MKKLLVAAALVELWLVNGWCQEFSKVDVFGGYSFTGIRHVRSIQNGWNSSVTFNVNSWLGITSDFAGHYLPETNTEWKLTQFSALWGPQFTYRGNPRFNPFGHVLFGVQHSQYERSTGPFATESHDNSFATAFGGGLDLKLNERFSLRPFQADYLVLGSRSLDNFRFSIGLVIHFGRN